MTENNREFEQAVPEKKLFYKFFRPPEGKEATVEWLSPAEILEEINKRNALPFSMKCVRSSADY